MFELLKALHLLFAVFAIGPLVHAATTAARGLRTADAAATASSARTVTIYSYVSVAVVILGFGLMSADNPYGDGKVAEISEPYIWVSTLLWFVAVGLALGVIAPALQTATARIGAGETVDEFRGRVAASGGIVGLVFAAIVFLMVYKPGS